jgi:hypothetical protein
MSLVESTRIVSAPGCPFAGTAEYDAMLAAQAQAGIDVAAPPHLAAPVGPLGAAATTRADSPVTDSVTSADVGAKEAAPPEDVAVFYDPLSYAAYDNPYELYRILREKAPVYYNRRRDLWVLSRYADVQQALQNSEQLSSAFGNDMDGTHASYGLGNLIAIDPPRHTELRAAVRRVFIGREVLAKEDGLRELCAELVGEMHAKGGGDFAVDVALPLAIATATRVAGLPIEDVHMLQDHLLRSMVRVVGEFGVPDDAAVSNQEAEHHIGEIFQERIEAIEGGADAGGSDVISQVIAGTSSNKVFEDEKVGLAHLILSAAIDAPAALMTNLVALLDKFPAFQSYLSENPSRIPDFVEESLRFDTPGQNLCRQTTAELTIDGVTIPENSRLMVLLASANRDERMFPDPEFFDINREFTPQNKIMSFGDGIHGCLGAPLARMIGRVLVETLLRGPELRIVGVPERWAKQMVRGFSSLPIVFLNDEESER